MPLHGSRLGRRSPTRHTIRLINIGQAAGAPLQFTLIEGGVLALMILALGGSKSQAGMLFTVTFLAFPVQALIAPWIAVIPLKRFVIGGMGASCLLTLGLLGSGAVEARLGTQAAVWYIIGVYAVSRVSMNIGAAAWFPLLAEVVPDTIRGRFLGRMRMTWRASTTAALVLAGFWLGDDPSVSRFYPLIIAIVAVGMVRPVLFTRLPAVLPAKNAMREPILRHLGRPLRDCDFRRFTLFTMSVGFGTVIGFAYAVPYLRKDMAFPGDVTLYASLFIGIGSIVSLVYWGKLVDRLGNRFTFLLSIVGRVIAMVTLALAPSYPQAGPAALAVAGFAFFFFGVGLSGGQMGFTVRLMHIAPVEHRAAYMNLFFTVIGIGNAVAVGVGGLLIDLLPEQVLIRGTPVETMRIFFVGAAGWLMLTMSGLRFLPPVREPGLSDAVGSAIAALPTPLNLPLIPLHWYTRRASRK
ncbi:MAG: MFS transporter [Phycisphaeraceae bacterium]